MQHVISQKQNGRSREIKNCHANFLGYYVTELGETGSGSVPVTNYARPVYLESWPILTLLELFLGPW